MMHLGLVCVVLVRSVYGDPVMIRLVWCGRLCFEGFCAECGCVEGSVWYVSLCHVPCGGSHNLIGV